MPPRRDAHPHMRVGVTVSVGGNELVLTDQPDALSGIEARRALPLNEYGHRVPVSEIHDHLRTHVALLVLGLLVLGLPILRLLVVPDLLRLATLVDTVPDRGPDRRARGGAVPPARVGVTAG